MKRKSGQHRAEKRKQARTDEATGPIIQEGDAFTQLELAPTQVGGVATATAAAAASWCAAAAVVGG